MSGLRFRLPFRLPPSRAEEAAKHAEAAVRDVLKALDDVFSDAQTGEERAFAEDSRRYFIEWLDAVAGEAQAFRLPDAADVEADRACDRMREVA